MNPMLIGEIKKYIENNIDKITDKEMENLCNKRDEIIKKIEQMKIDPEAQERGRLFLALLCPSGEGEGKGCTLEASAVKLMAFALYYLIKKHDLVPDWHPISGLDDDALMINYVYNEVVPAIQAYKDCSQKQ